jgi:predicted nucleotidyltransferase
MMSVLSSLLFKDYRRRVLSLLLLHSEESYHVREIARLTGTVAGTLHKELAKLADAGVLLKKASGNQVRYKANPDCPIIEELTSILRKTSGIVDVLADALLPLAEKISVAFVFGSMASGKETASSDVDVLIVGDASFSEVVSALYSAQDVLQREINPKIFNREEWIQMREQNDAFVKEVLSKPRLIIMGSENEPG